MREPDPDLGAVGVQELWLCPALPNSLEDAKKRGSEFDLGAGHIPCARESPAFLLAQFYGISVLPNRTN